jgi:SAM-dependent methyltransferase
MAEGLDASTRIVGSDLNEPMIDYAVGVGTARPVEWRQADVLDLPFGDGTFDAVVCQFGVMFFPNRVRAMSEVRRVLRPGGTFLFSIWDRIETNEFAAIVTDSLAELFPDDPPRFLPRTPHGYYEEKLVQRHIADAGFVNPVGFEPVEARSRAASHATPAIAYCQGTPLRDEIEARGLDRLDEATSVAAEAIARRFGRSDVDGRIRGFVVSATKR